MGRFTATNLAVGVLIVTGALKAAEAQVEEIVVKPDPPKQRRNAPEDQPQAPVSRQHRRAMERAARKRLSTTQGEKTNG